jgi:hypothetical protein
VTVAGCKKHANEGDIIGLANDGEAAEAFNFAKKIAPEHPKESGMTVTANLINMVAGSEQSFDETADHTSVEFVGARRHKRVTPAMNATLMSQGRSRTIIIEPIGSNSATFLQYPVNLAQGIRDSAYGKFSNFKFRVFTNPRKT